MYPYAPVPRLFRALALIQAVIAVLALLGLVIFWMASTPDLSRPVPRRYAEYTSDPLGLTASLPVLFQLVLLLVALIGLAVFVARGSLVARVSSCCAWGVLMIVGLLALQINPAFVLVLFVSLCMLISLALADRLAGGRGAPG